MALSKVFTPWSVVLDAHTAQGGTEAYIHGITDLSLNLNLTTAVEQAAAIGRNTFGSLVSGAPVASFTTSELKLLLDECGVTGMLVDSGASGDGVDIYWQQRKLGGTYKGGATDHHTVVGDGILVPRSISLSHMGRGTVTCELIAVSSNGILNPVTFSETATLPASQYPAVTQVHSLGKVDLNGTPILGVTDCTIDFGIQTIVEVADSNAYPTFVSIQSIAPSITVSGKHIDFTTTLTEAGLYMASGMKIFAVKRSEGGTVVADGTAEHISFTMGKCRAEPVSIGGDPANIGMKITPWYTNAGSPTSEITIATAVAIT